MMQRLRSSKKAKTFPKRDSHYYGKEAVIFAGLLVHHPHVGWKWLLCVSWSLSGGSIIQARPPALISGHHLITQCLPSSNMRHEWASQVVNNFARMQISPSQMFFFRPLFKTKTFCQHEKEGNYPNTTEILTSPISRDTRICKRKRIV